MPFPQGTDYNVVVQHPRTAFADRHLKECLPETTPLGLPKPYSGGFTTTYHLVNRKLGYDWAVRCFTRGIPDLEARYKALERFFDRHRHETCFVKTWYLQNGIRASGSWHPTIKMQWVEGVSLDGAVRAQLSKPAMIEKLATEFAALIRRLEQIGFAHGDLQHGNILVKEGKLYLIDYDGSYVPEIAGLGTNNLGHVNYQHPARSETLFNAQVDRFSAIVIFLGLAAVAAQPSLWRDFDNGENILFRRDDFADPAGSALFARLSSSSQSSPGTSSSMSALVERFRQICRFNPHDVPSLDAFLKGDYAAPKTRVAAPWYGRRSQYPVIDCNQRELLLQHVGQRVEVIGCVSQIYENKGNLSPYQVLHLGRHAYPYHAMTLILWTEGLKSFREASRDSWKLMNRWVSATGVIAVYSVNGRLVPQIIVDHQAQIQELPRGEIDARAKLAAYALDPEIGPVSLRDTTRAATFKRGPTDERHEAAAAAVFNRLYGGGSAPKENGIESVSKTSSRPQHQAAAAGARWYEASVNVIEPGSRPAARRAARRPATPSTTTRIIGNQAVHTSSPAIPAASSLHTDSFHSFQAQLADGLRKLKGWLVGVMSFVRQRP